MVDAKCLFITLFSYAFVCAVLATQFKKNNGELQGFVRTRSTCLPSLHANHALHCTCYEDYGIIYDIYFWCSLIMYAGGKTQYSAEMNLFLLKWPCLYHIGIYFLPGVEGYCIQVSAHNHQWFLFRRRNHYTIADHFLLPKDSLGYKLIWGMYWQYIYIMIHTYIFLSICALTYVQLSCRAFMLLILYFPALERCCWNLGPIQSWFPPTLCVYVCGVT